MGILFSIIRRMDKFAADNTYLHEIDVNQTEYNFIDVLMILLGATVGMINKCGGLIKIRR